MSKLIALLLMMTALSRGQAEKLGSDADPTRQMLFANVPMKQLLQRVKLDGSPGPFQTIADAAKLADEGRTDGAKERLRSILSLPSVESRIQLLVWTALRGLGESPDPKIGKEVLGVVVEVPVHGAYDSLAAYADGSARYLNYSGAAIFWDTPDPKVKSLGQALIATAAQEAPKSVPRTSTALPESGTQITLLTPSGIYVIRPPSAQSMNAASSLMAELTARARQKKS